MAFLLRHCHANGVTQPAATRKFITFTLNNKQNKENKTWQGKQRDIQMI